MHSKILKYLFTLWYNYFECALVIIKEILRCEDVHAGLEYFPGLDKIILPVDLLFIDNSF